MFFSINIPVDNFPFLDHPTKSSTFPDDSGYLILDGRPVSYTTNRTPLKSPSSLFSSEEPYNEIMPLDIVSYNQPGITYNSYQPEPKTQVEQTSTERSYNPEPKISNMLHGLSFHDEDASQNKRVGPQ